MIRQRRAQIVKQVLRPDDPCLPAMRCEDNWPAEFAMSGPSTNEMFHRSVSEMRNDDARALLMMERVRSVMKEWSDILSGVAIGQRDSLKKGSNWGLGFRLRRHAVAINDASWLASSLASDLIYQIRVEVAVLIVALQLCSINWSPLYTSGAASSRYTCSGIVSTVWSGSIAMDCWVLQSRRLCQCDGMVKMRLECVEAFASVA